ncbi:hypothetical protein J2X36_005282 [Methylobacterium sp. BE186]|nr:hypothetical protein [Methylobacterium sp. BE186]
MRHNRTLAGAEQRSFLDRAKGCRKECIRVLSRTSVHSPVYVAASGIVDTIDGLAKAITGDRKHVNLRMPTTSGWYLTPPPEAEE